MNLKQLFDNEGYLPVALPLSDIKPKQILVKDGGSLRRMPDEISQLFKPGSSALPPTRRNKTVPNLTGNLAVTSEIKADASALEVLKNWLQSTFSFKTEITSDDKIVYAFENVLRDEVTSFVELNEYLNESTVSGGAFGDVLLSSDIYAITSVLKSTKFTLAIVDTGKFNLEVNLPTIQDIVSGNITVGRTSDKQRFIQYEGAEPMIFAVQAVRVIYDRSLMDKLFNRKGQFKINTVTGLIVRGEEDYKVETLAMDDALML
jgi:hypothetical protein